MAKYNIELYSNKSDKRVINKDITKIDTITGNSKSSFNLLTPVFTVKNNPNINRANYAYIPLLKRYYYIATVNFGAFTTISLKEDVLMSNKDEILKQVIISGRTSSGDNNKINYYIQDNKTVISSKPKITRMQFPNTMFGKTENVLILAGPSYTQVG